LAILIGFHPVVEALKAGRSLDKIMIAKGAGGPRVQEIVNLARAAHVLVRFEERGALGRLAGTEAHQGVVAMGAASKYSEFDEVAADARLVVVLDGVEDPHNLGAIVRTAHAAGANAIVIPERRAVGLTETVAKTAAGALEHLPISRVTNINRTLEDLKKRGYWIYGVDERGTVDYDKVDWAVPSAIVMGAEGKGLHQQTKQHCDFLIRIPMEGKIASLNVSVATGIVLFQWKSKTTTS
jgi:23S rRNA (guanosine2251-2'-O)-methyltransferase